MEDVELYTGILLQGLINNSVNHEDLPQQDRERLVMNARGWAEELLSSFEQTRAYYFHVDNVDLFTEEAVRTLEKQIFLSFKEAMEYVDIIHQWIDRKELRDSLFIVEVSRHCYAVRYFRIDGYEIFPSLYDWLRLCRFKEQYDRTTYAFHFDDLSSMSGNTTFVEHLEEIEMMKMQEKEEAVLKIKELMRNYQLAEEHCLETVYIIQLIERDGSQMQGLEERMTRQFYNCKGEPVAPKFQSSVRFDD